MSAALTVACVTTSVNLLITVPLLRLNICPAVLANVGALLAECPLAYALLRRYVWKAEQVSEISRARSVFVVLYAATLVLSSVAVAVAERLTRSMERTPGTRTIVLLGAQWSSFCVLWLLEFLLLDSAVFRSRTRRQQEPREPQ
jgi:putative flippase GtrA